MIKSRIIIFVFLLITSCCCKDREDQRTISSKTSSKIENKIKALGVFTLKDFHLNNTILNSFTEETFNSLNDTERVAQMIMTSIGNNGKHYETIKRLVAGKKIGGAILMSGSKNLFKSTINKIDSITKLNNSLPMIYSVDAEPGFVGSRITGTRTFPPQSSIKSISGADSISNKISELLKDIGININLAPVCDISINKEIINERSFGRDSEKITNYAIHFIKSTQRNNIIATVKHFPGHGNVLGDSHKDLVFIDGNMTELETFKKIIDSSKVLAVMVGHIAVKNNSEYDTGGLPATLSKKIVTDLLRNKIGFKGLIITDALNMGAVTKFEKPSLRAALAGCDILLMPTDEIKLIDSMLIEMNKNIVFKKQVYDSVKRIIKAKICLGLIKT